MRMGRRAADLTTPIPVLGVPALVGVRGWRTCGGDRMGGSLLQTWGLQCSIGVQTSPGISRPAAQQTVQLGDAPSMPPSDIVQTSSSFITRETNYKHILLQTDSDKGKGTLVKQRSRESKTKKEVTFKALEGDTCNDVHGFQMSGGNDYGAKAGNVASITPKLKSTGRYTNGSVVDSEAMGGISIDSDETLPIKAVKSGGRGQTKLHGHFAEMSGKMLLISAPRPFSVPPRICSHCGGRRPVSTEAASSGRRGLPADCSQAQTPLKSAPDVPHSETPVKPLNHQLSGSPATDKGTLSAQLLHGDADLTSGGTTHPACPVHSANKAFFSHTHPAKSNQRKTILHDESLTVTKATIEARKDDDCPTSQRKPDGKIPRPASLMLTPLMATATKANNPQSHVEHLHPPPRSSTTSATQNVCVSVHAPAESKRHSYTAEVGAGNTLTSDVALTSTVIRPANGANANATAAAECSAQCSTNSSKRVPESETAAPAGPSPASASQKNSSELKALCKDGFINSGAVPSFANTRHATTPGPLTPAAASNGGTSSQHHAKQSLCNSSSVLNLCLKTSPVNETIDLAISSTQVGNKPHSTTSCPLSAPKEKHNNVTASLQTAHTHQHHKARSCNETRLTNTPHRKATTAIRDNTTNESAFCCRASSEKNICNPTWLSLNMSKNHKGSGASDTLVNIGTQRPTAIPDLTTRDERRSNTDPADKNTVCSDPVNELLLHESKDSECSNTSQVTKLHNFISLMKPSGSSLRACTNTEERMHVHYPASTASQSEGQRATCPAVKTSLQKDSNAGHVAPLAMHANTELQSKAEKQTHPNYSAASVTAQTICDSMIGSLANSVDQKQTELSSGTRPHAGPESSAAAAPCSSGGGHTAAESNSTCTSSSVPLAPLSRLRSSETEELVSPYSKFSPAPPRLHPEDTTPAHSHPAAAALLLPPSPQCCKSAALQQRLESVEASLAANKERITTLLHIIHDLETGHTPTAG